MKFNPPISYQIPTFNFPNPKCVNEHTIKQIKSSLRKKKKKKKNQKKKKKKKKKQT